MKTYKCLSCNKDMTIGLVMLSKSSIYPDNIRYMHCSECGRSHLLDLETGKMSDIDFSIEGIEADIILGLNDCIKVTYQEKEKKHTCDCDNTCKECNCLN